MRSSVVGEVRADVSLIKADRGAPSTHSEKGCFGFIDGTVIVLQSSWRPGPGWSSRMQCNDRSSDHELSPHGFPTRKSKERDYKMPGVTVNMCANWSLEFWVNGSRYFPLRLGEFVGAVRPSYLL